MSDDLPPLPPPPLPRTRLLDMQGVRRGCVRVMLHLMPVSLSDANAFVSAHHRHHPPVIGHKYSIAIHDGESVRGVVIVSRPVARRLDDGVTLEVTRCCTDGVKNGCSMLYGAAWRAAKALGYKRMVTYTMNDESGASLSGAGWKCIGEAGGGNWNVRTRPRADSAHQQKKLRWDVECGESAYD